MIRLSGGPFARLIPLAAVLALGAAGCGATGGSASPADAIGSDGASAAASVDSGASPAATNDSGIVLPSSSIAVATSGVPAAGRKLAGVASFRFSLTMQGSGFDNLAQGLGALSGEALTISGTIVERPAKAASIETEGMQVVQIGDKAWMNQDNGWIDVDAASLGDVADAFSPDDLYTLILSGTAPNDWQLVGDETKDGIASVHYRAQGSAPDVLGGHIGADAGTTRGDVWLAKSGGYPVSASIVGKGGGSDAQFVLTVTNVDDPANAVTPPA